VSPTPTPLQPESRRAADRTMLGCMFIVTDTDAAAIRAAFHQGGEFAAAELRRLFPDVGDTAQARACARSIAGWKPLMLPLRPATRPRRLSRGE
jgi:hypothetical protein